MHEVATFDGFIGKTNSIAKFCQSKIQRANSMPIAWLFHGPPGTGKSNLAKLCAMEIAKSEFAIERVSGATLGVDVVRGWLAHLNYIPLYGKATVKWIEELDLASDAAQNAMLLLLDQLPKHWAVIATTNENLKALQPRLQSRFQQRKFEKVEAIYIEKYLCNHYGVTQNIAQQISYSADGDVRLAINDGLDTLA